MGKEETAANREGAVPAISALMPPDDVLNDVSAFFKIFAEPTRVNIACALTASELCVSDIADILGMSASAISHQLRIMKQLRLVKSRRSGKAVYYRLGDRHIGEILKTAFEHVTEEG